ncbi:hypothetical protein [Streptomyces sp. NPDC017529]|uniref:hypothetical protein n=1 Tax=Streptomyces sp. NPDC017529 TaxID=3365000 RepID=UPI0037B87B7D
MTHAEALRRVGSYLVIIADEHGWPEELSASLAQVVVRVENRPSPHRVATAHLEYLHHKPERLRRLNTAASGTGAALVGGAAHLLTEEETTPAEAARLATLLARADDSDDGLKTALATFQQWRTEVTEVFKNTEGKPADRALLIAALFLSGDTVLRTQDAARALLNKPPETDVEAILSGPDLTTRLSGVKVKVTGRHATLDRRPGYAQAVLNYLWWQRPDIHLPLLKWLDTITAPNQPGATRIAAISDLLVELAIAENDIRVIDQIRAWIDNGNTNAEHLQLIAVVLIEAAEADSLGAEVRARLLKWAQDDAEPVAKVIAMVCQSQFADHFPRQALARLRHILDRATPDIAVGLAEEALRAIATRPGQLPRVWDMITKWATEHGHLAGHRAFLSLLDPQDDPYVLQVLLEAAGQKPEVKTALMRGWRAALADSRVATQCRDLVIAWAHARAEELVPYDLVTDILRQVVSEPHVHQSRRSARLW